MKILFELAVFVPQLVSLARSLSLSRLANFVAFRALLPVSALSFDLFGTDGEQEGIGRETNLPSD